MAVLIQLQESIFNIEYHWNLKSKLNINKFTTIGVIFETFTFGHPSLEQQLMVLCLKLILSVTQVLLKKKHDSSFRLSEVLYAS